MSRKLINVVMQGGGGAAELAVNTTWAELKAMRDNSELTVGCLYRITDYETIISGADVQSAGHVFDIVVLATDVNQLSEDAMAVHSERDTEGYFADSKLEAWELKYCLDNDQTRFSWASETGKGVIYKMIDEHNNYCGYDFKNVQFKRYKITATKENPSEEEFSYFGKYAGQDLEYGVTLPDGYVIDDDDSRFFYTFSSINNENDAIMDNSLGINFPEMGSVSFCKSNIIKEFSFPFFDLNNNVFIAYYNSEADPETLMGSLLQINNYIDYGCKGNTLINVSQDNKLGMGCYDNLLFNGINNILKTECISNTFCDMCKNNELGNNCEDNLFSIFVQSNILKDNAKNNIFGEGFVGCLVETGFHDSRVLNNVMSCSIGKGVAYVEFGNEGPTGVIFGCRILSGVSGDSINVLSIPFELSVNTNGIQVAGLDSQGNLKIWNPADLVQA